MRTAVNPKSLITLSGSGEGAGQTPIGELLSETLHSMFHWILIRLHLGTLELLLASGVAITLCSGFSNAGKYACEPDVTLCTDDDDQLYLY